MFLPGAGNRVELGEESFVFGVFVPPDGRPRWMSQLSPPLIQRPVLDAMSGRASRLMLGGCAGHIASARGNRKDTQ